MKGWPSVKIGKLCDVKNTFVQTGPFGSQLHESDYSTEGIPVIMPKDILQGKISTRSIARVSENHVLRLKRHKVLTGDIIYGRRGDIGRHALIQKHEEGWLCGTGCLLIRTNKSKVDGLYIHYYLAQQSVIDYVANQAIGATMPNLNTKILQNIPVTLPPLPIQRKIAAVLSAYDDLIENNNRRIAILEKMAEELYREWFVRLRFPGHEKVKIVKGVPEGWEVKKIGDVVKFEKGKNPNILREEKTDDSDIYLNVDAIENGKYLYAPKLKSIICQKTESLMLMDGARSSVVFIGQEGIVSSTFAVVRTHEKYRGMLHEYLKANLDAMVSNNTGSAIPHANKEFIIRMLIKFPVSDELIKSFNEAYMALSQDIQNSRKKTAILTTARGRLLSRLMSGKIDVEDLDIQFPPSMDVPGKEEKEAAN